MGVRDGRHPARPGCYTLVCRITFEHRQMTFRDLIDPYGVLEELLSWCKRKIDRLEQTKMAGAISPNEREISNPPGKGPARGKSPGDNRDFRGVWGGEVAGYHFDYLKLARILYHANLRLNVTPNVCCRSRAWSARHAACKLYATLGHGSKLDLWDSCDLELHGWFLWKLIQTD